MQFCVSILGCYTEEILAIFATIAIVCHFEHRAYDFLVNQAKVSTQRTFGQETIWVTSRYMFVLLVVVVVVVVVPCRLLICSR